MIRGLLGKKIGMSQIFDKEGNIMPVTLVEAGPCTILELKDNPHRKVKIGFQPVTQENRISKPLRGYFKKLGITPMRVIKEFSSTDNKEYQVGQELNVNVFRPGDFVDVTGTSIGKGFQGGMKRWGWSGGGATHGSMHHRRIGAVSSGSDPSRVYKGKTMPGHMGAQTVTTEGLRVMDVDQENNVMYVKGAVPGHRNAIVSIRRSEKKAFKSLDEKTAVIEHKRNPMKQSKAKATGKGK